MTQDEYVRLKEWIDTLDINTLKSISLECITELMYSEVIRFPEESTDPYWINSGDSLNDIY